MASAAFPGWHLRWMFHGNEVTILDIDPNSGDAIHVYDVSSQDSLPEIFHYRLDDSIDYLGKMRASQNAVLIWSQDKPTSLNLIDRNTATHHVIDMESEIIDFDLKRSY